MSIEEQFRAAWLAVQDDSFPSRLARQSLEASAEQDPKLRLTRSELKSRPGPTNTL